MDDPADGLKGLFRSAAGAHVEGAHGIVTLKDRKPDLFRLLAETSVADVPYDADDFDVGFGSRKNTAADTGAERVAAREVTVDERLVDDR